MFDNGPKEGTSSRGCKRDLKAEAERLNKQFLANKEMLVATKKFIKFGNFYDLDRDIKTHHFTLLGALEIKVEEQAQNLDMLLSMIEKEEAEAA